MLKTTPSPRGESASPNGHRPRSLTHAIALGCLSMSLTSLPLLAQLPHPDDPAKQAEHLALFDLVPLSEATHVTVKSGNWNNSATWQGGNVPGADDRAYIQAGHSVTYNANRADALEWLRVDGTLKFATGSNTRLVVETFVVDPGGVLEIGTAANPIAANRTAIIEIDTTGGPISRTEDPFVLSRGLISHGATTIHGAVKKAFTRLQSEARAGDTKLILNDTTLPAGWQVGDILLLAGTTADLAETSGQDLFGGNSSSVAEDAENSRFRDELLQITGMNVVNGRAEISFTNVTNDAALGLTSLLWDHTRPDGDLFGKWELHIHVANLTRNVVVRSSDPSVDAQERGHFMIMHNPNANLRYMLCQDLGRTDKSIPADDPAVLGNFDGSPSTGTNPRGRYGLHLHRVGASSYSGVRSEVVGNVVWGSPGWGIVHHDSYALLEDNVVFDVVGAGIIAEDGSEIGTWRNNLCVKMTGAPGANFDDNPIPGSGRGIRFDLGFVGSGYWIQGGAAGLILENNIAASCNAAGFDIVPKTGLTPLPYSTFPSDLLRIPALRDELLAAGLDEVAINAATSAPIVGIQVYNSFRGIHTWLHKRNDGDKEHTLNDAPGTNHPYHMVVDNFRIWNVLSGVQNLYSQSMTFTRGLVIGNPTDPVPFDNANDGQDNNVEGIALSHNADNATNLHFDEMRIEGFEYGMRQVHSYNKNYDKHAPYTVGSLTDSQLANVDYAFIGRGHNGNATLYPYFILENNSVATTTGNTPPTASFTTSSLGGYAVYFDASDSIDPDLVPASDPTDMGIVAYAWDFNSDGVFDDWGVDSVFTFNAPGTRTVTLTVFDGHHASATTSLDVNVTAEAYGNALVDSQFDQASGSVIDTKRFSSFRAVNSRDRDEGWLGDNLTNAGGYLQAIGVPKLVQVVRDEYVVRGDQTLKFRFQHTSNQPDTADLWVTVYGVNGEFDFTQDAVSDDAAHPVDASILPMDSTVVLRENIGGPQHANWKWKEISGDFAGGYEYIVVHFSGDGQDIAGGDTFAIDNVTLTGEAPAGSEAIITFEELVQQTIPSLEALDSNGVGWTFEGEPGVNVKVYSRDNSMWLGTTFNGDEGYRFRRTDGATFSLLSADLQNLRANRTYTVTGIFEDDTQISTTVFMGGWGDRFRSLTFESWSNLKEVRIDNGDQNDGRVWIDNIRVF